MGFAEAWKKTQTAEENIHPNELQKVQKDHFTVFAVPEGACNSKKNEPQASTPDPGNRPGDDPWFDDMICMVIEQLNAAGIRYTDASPQDRERARALEMEYTVAANNGEAPRFWKALREWKGIWIKELH
jgi:hypothetical protein